MTLKTILQERRHIGRDIEGFLLSGKVLSIDQISIKLSFKCLRCESQTLSLYWEIITFAFDYNSFTT